MDGPFARSTWWFAIAAAVFGCACSSGSSTGVPAGDASLVGLGTGGGSTLMNTGGVAAGGGGTPGASTGGAAPAAGGAPASGTGGTPGPSAGGTASDASGHGPRGSGGADAETDGGNAAGSGAKSNPPRPSTGPGDWGPGDYPPDLTSQTYLELSGVPGQNGHVRQYKVHVPPGYDPDVPAPVVFCFHGLLQNAVMFCVTGAAMNEKSDQEGFVLVMPNGYQNSWNAGTCCGGASNEKLDDVGLVRAIFAEVGKHVNIDLGRVYATGLSNGGYMSYRLACDASDLFVAVAPGAGAIGTNDIGGGTNPISDFTACNPTRPVSVLDVHGTADGLVPYSLQAPSLARMVGKDGCTTTASPAPLPQSGGDTTCVTYSGCTAGVEVTGCSIQGGGHCWFGSPDCGTGGGAIGAAFVGANSDTMKNTDAAWAFFERHSR